MLPRWLTLTLCLRAGLARPRSQRVHPRRCARVPPGWQATCWAKNAQVDSIIRCCYWGRALSDTKRKLLQAFVLRMHAPARLRGLLSSSYRGRGRSAGLCLFHGVQQRFEQARHIFLARWGFCAEALLQAAHNASRGLRQGCSLRRGSTLMLSTDAFLVVPVTPGLRCDKRCV